MSGGYLGVPEHPVTGSEHWTGLLREVEGVASPSPSRRPLLPLLRVQEWHKGGHTVTETRLVGPCEHPEGQA